MKKITASQIREIMPYKEPFLFIDEVVEWDESHIVTERLFKPEEDFFKGHFSGYPIIPGVLLLEATGQAASLLIRKLHPGEDIDILAFEIKKATFKNPGFPNDKMRFEVEVKNKTPFWWDKKKPRLYGGHGKMFCGDELRATGSFNLAVLDKNRFRNKFMKVNVAESAKAEKKEE